MRLRRALTGLMQKQAADVHRARLEREVAVAAAARVRNSELAVVKALVRNALDALDGLDSIDGAQLFYIQSKRGTKVTYRTGHSRTTERRFRSRAVVGVPCGAYWQYAPGGEDRDGVRYESRAIRVDVFLLSNGQYLAGRGLEVREDHPWPAADWDSIYDVAVSGHVDQRTGEIDYSLDLTRRSAFPPLIVERLRALAGQ